MGRYRQPYSLYKRGKYYYYKTYKPDGTRTSGTSTGCTSLGAARQFCDTLYLRGSLCQSDVTLYNYAVNFFDDDGIYFKNAVKQYSDNTKKNYRMLNRLYILPYFKKTKLADVTYTRLKEFRASLLRDKSIKTTSEAMNILKHIIVTAWRDGLIGVNPFTYLEPINIIESARDAFTLEEVRQLYNESSDEFKKGILCIALTGLRISEYVGLTPEMFIQGEKNGDQFLYIDLKTQLNNGRVIPVKSGSARPIPVIPAIMDLIGFDPTRVSAWYREYNKLKTTFKDYEERKLCFHSLRHFFITNTKASGIPDIKIEFIAGHKLKGISRVYTNFKVEDVLEVIEWQKKTLAIITGESIIN